jgi:hypothetical protein
MTRSRPSPAPCSHQTASSSSSPRSMTHWYDQLTAIFIPISHHLLQIVVYAPLSIKCRPLSVHRGWKRSCWLDALKTKFYVSLTVMSRSLRCSLILAHWLQTLASF